MTENKLNYDDVKIFVSMLIKEKFSLHICDNKVFIILTHTITSVRCDENKLYIEYKDSGADQEAFFLQSYIEKYIKGYKDNYFKSIAIEDKTTYLAEELDKLREEVKQLKAKLGQ
jgi:hypothetical protein